MNLMEKMANWVDAKIGPVAGKISSWGFIKAIVSCFITIQPLILLGAFASLFAGIPWDPYLNFIKNAGIYSLLNLVVQLTTNCIALYVAFSITWSAAKEKHEASSVIMGFVSMYVFLILCPLSAGEKGKFIGFNFLGAKGLVVALISGYVVYAIFNLCYKYNINIRMPKGVPPAMAESFRALIPAAFCTIVALVVYAITEAQGGIVAIIYAIIAAPFSALADNVVTFCLIDTMRQLFWFFGIHGGNVMSAISNVLYQGPTAENIANFAAGLPLEHLITNGTDALAGGGQNLCFCLSILCMFSKKSQLKQLGRLSILPGLFKITEPIRFGLPMVMNPYFIIPILVADFVQHGLLYALTVAGIMPIARNTMVTGPFFLADIMNAGFVPGMLWWIFTVILGLVVAYPFFKAYEKSLPDEEEEGAEAQA